MPNNIEMKAGRESHVGFESQGLLLMAPMAQGPLHGQRTRQEANGEASFFKPARRKMKGCLKARAASLPAEIGDAAFSKAGRLHPLQHVRRTFAIVAEKPRVPCEGDGNGRHCVDGKEPSQGA